MTENFTDLVDRFFLRRPLGRATGIVFFLAKTIESVTSFFVHLDPHRTMSFPIPPEGAVSYSQKENTYFVYIFKVSLTLGFPQWCRLKSVLFGPLCSVERTTLSAQLTFSVKLSLSSKLAISSFWESVFRFAPHLCRYLFSVRYIQSQYLCFSKTLYSWDKLALPRFILFLQYPILIDEAFQKIDYLFHVGFLISIRNQFLFFVLARSSLAYFCNDNNCCFKNSLELLSAVQELDLV